MVDIKFLLNIKAQSQNNKKKLQSQFPCLKISLKTTAGVAPLIVLVVFFFFLVLFLPYYPIKLKKKKNSLKNSNTSNRNNNLNTYTH